MAKSALSSTTLQVAKDFTVLKGEHRLPAPKLKAWVKKLGAVPESERVGLAAELIALASALEAQPGGRFGAGQLYFCAAGLIQKAAVASGWSSAKKPKR